MSYGFKKLRKVSFPKTNKVYQLDKTSSQRCYVRQQSKANENNYIFCVLCIKVIVAKLDLISIYIGAITNSVRAITEIRFVFYLPECFNSANSHTISTDLSCDQKDKIIRANGKLVVFDVVQKTRFAAITQYRIVNLFELENSPARGSQTAFNEIRSCDDLRKQT